MVLRDVCLIHLTNFDFYAIIIGDICGCLHFCSRGDHYVPSLCEIERLNGINLSQPELNDMDVILQTVCAKDKRIVGLAGAERFAQRPYMKPGILHA